MTIYLIKLKYIVNPFEIDTDEYIKGLPVGLYLNWFRQFDEWEWITKLQKSDIVK